MITSALRYLTYAAVFLVIIVLAIVGGFRTAAFIRESQTPSDAAPKHGSFAKVDDINLYYEEYGPKDGTPVVFIHGALAWSGTWRAQMQAAAGVGYRALALDLPPFGFSEKPAGFAYGPERQATRILEFLDRLGLDSVVLVGHSFGGGATVEAALKAPQRISGLVLADVAIGVTKPKPAESSAAVPKILDNAGVRDTLMALTFTNPLMASPVLKQFVKDPNVATAERLKLYTAPLVVRGSTKAVGEWLISDLLPYHDKALSNTASQYAQLRMPTLIVWGKEDTVTPLVQAQVLKELIPQANMVVLENVNHIPHIEDPDRFNTELTAFLRILSK
jgi:pimeloyl-ACP methyl ester carboxylesterase